MPENKNIKSFLKDLAKDAKRDIAWLASIHVTLRSSQQNILPEARQLLINPRKNLRIRNLPYLEAKKKRTEAVKIFNVFCDYAIEPPEQKPEHYLNKSAILYLDTILQVFLDKCYETIAKNDKELTKKELKRNSICGKLEEIQNDIPEISLTTENHVKFIAQLRHIIYP